jgi:hypothetical protein
MCKIKKELYIYVGIFFILSFAVHIDAWFNYPLEHLQALSSSSLGTFHPFIISLAVYVIILIVRIVLNFIGSKLRKRSYINNN